MKCEHCGQELRKAKPKAIETTVIDVSTCTRDQLYAHYKRTAPNEDAAFFLQHAGRDLLHVECVELARLSTEIPTNRVEHYRKLTAIQNAWRRRPHPVADAFFVIHARQERKRTAGAAYRTARSAALQAIHAATDEELHTRTYDDHYRKNLDRRDIAYRRVRALVEEARALMPWKFPESDATV